MQPFAGCRFSGCDCGRGHCSIQSEPTRANPSHIIGVVLWTTGLLLLGFGLADIPGIADFAPRYIDLMLIGIVVFSVVPVVIRAVGSRRQNSRL